MEVFKTMVPEDSGNRNNDTLTTGLYDPRKKKTASSRLWNLRNDLYVKAYSDAVFFPLSYLYVLERVIMSCGVYNILRVL